MGASQGGLGIFYVDESFPKPVRVAMATLRDDVRYAGGDKAPAEGLGDDEWLPWVGAKDWSVIHRDNRIRKRPRERQALLDSGVRTFCFTHAGNYNRWDTMRVLAHRWPDIERTAASEAGPYICSVTWSGVRKLFIPGGDA
jgi:hypothetical protein